MEKEDDVLIPASAARGLQVWARRLLRCCGPMSLGGAVAQRRRIQDENSGDVAVAFYGGDEFALWKNLESDLGAHDALLRPITGALNCGLEGATARDLRDNAFGLMARHNPPTVVLSVGSADYDAQCWFGLGHEQALDNCMDHVGEVIDTAYKFGTRDARLLVVPQPPGFSQDKREFMNEVAARLYDLTRTFDTTVWYGLRLELLDIREMLGRDLDRMHDAYAGDEIRPTPYAHQLKGDVLRNLLGPFGESPLGRPQFEVGGIRDEVVPAAAEDAELVSSEPTHDSKHYRAFRDSPHTEAGLPCRFVVEPKLLGPAPGELPEQVVGGLKQFDGVPELAASLHHQPDGMTGSAEDLHPLLRK